MLKRFGWFSAAVLLMLVSPAVVKPQQAQEQTATKHTLSQTEAKYLLKTASTPEDHLALAAYLRDQAREEQAAAKFQIALAQNYRENPSSYEGHNWSYQQLKEHCDNIAKAAQKASVKLFKEADYHEWIAKQIREHPNQRHVSNR